ncbi:hypothetical protein Tco_1136662 [Tanacetum coccineum]
MKTLFRSQDLWDLVGKGCADSTSEETTNKENRKSDAKALFFIQQAVDETIFSRIAAAKSAKEACDTLKTEYQSSAKVITVNQMRAYGDKVADDIVVAKIQRSLSFKSDHVVAAIEESKDLSTYSIDELLVSLQTHEAINRNVVKEEEHDFQVQGEQAKFSYNRSRGREKFKNVDETLKSQVRLGDDKQVQVEGNGTVVVTLQGRERFIPDVHYAPGLAHNLLSVGQLMDRGFDVFFNSKNKTCTVIKDGEVMVKSSMTENRMFPVDFSCDNIYGLISSKEESTDNGTNDMVIAFGFFKKFKALAENQSNRKLKEVWDKNMMGLGSSITLEVQKEGITEEQPNTTCSLESNVTPSGISQVNTCGDTSQSITTQSSRQLLPQKPQKKIPRKSAIGCRSKEFRSNIPHTNATILAYAVGLVSKVYAYVPSKATLWEQQREYLRNIACTTNVLICSGVSLGLEATSYCRLIFTYLCSNSSLPSCVVKESVGRLESDTR